MSRFPNRQRQSAANQAGYMIAVRRAADAVRAGRDPRDPVLVAEIAHFSGLEAGAVRVLLANTPRGQAGGEG